MSPSLLDLQSVRTHLARRLLIAGPDDRRAVALTFDDGPHPRHTPWLLDLLARKGIKATFFVVGRRVRLFRDLVARIHAEGHELGNHGDHHVGLSILPDALIARELRVCGDLVAGVTGRRPRFMRPPMGWINDRVLRIAREQGYEPVIGSVHPQDSRQPGTEAILRRIRRRIEPGAIVILHDGGWRLGVNRGQTLEAVDVLTDELLAGGYELPTLSGLMDRGGIMPSVDISPDAGPR